MNNDESKKNNLFEPTLVDVEENKELNKIEEKKTEKKTLDSGFLNNDELLELEKKNGISNMYDEFKKTEPPKEEVKEELPKQEENGLNVNQLDNNSNTNTNPLPNSDNNQINLNNNNNITPTNNVWPNNQNNNPVVNNNQVTPKKNNGKMGIIVFILILLIIGGGAYLLFFSNKQVLICESTSEYGSETISMVFNNQSVGKISYTIVYDLSSIQSEELVSLKEELLNSIDLCKNTSDDTLEVDNCNQIRENDKITATIDLKLKAEYRNGKTISEYRDVFSENGMQCRIE